jgi:hypothetical protein
VKDPLNATTEKWHDLEITIRVCAPGEDAEAAVLEVARAVHDIGVLGVHGSDGMEVEWTRIDANGLPEVSVEDDVDTLSRILAGTVGNADEGGGCD